MVAPIKTKAISPPHVASSPTHDIVDNLLGAIVGSHLTKDKASGSSPVQTTLNRGQVRFSPKGAVTTANRSQKTDAEPLANDRSVA